ncbi:MAG: glycosyltransferase family 9 protein [Ignavibacteria bacterium]|nr:glycosyltransferase family 9 protein [Ignavibacteria bacterium]
MAKQKRILVVRTDRIGDTVMVTPVVRELKKAFPDSFVATLSQPNTADIFLNNPYVDLIITDDLKKESFRKVVSKIKENKFTHGLIIFPTERAAYQLFLGRVKKRYMTGFRLYSLFTFTRSVSREKYVKLKHEADYCMDLARRIGVKTNNVIPEIFVSEEEKSESIKFLEDNNIPNDIFKIFLHTGSKNSSPNWSENRYFELLTEIIKKFNEKDFRIVLTAMEMSHEFINKVTEMNDKRIVNIADKVKGLRKFICSISNADLMICSSTGPIHLADALDVKCIGIYCRLPMCSAKYWGVLNKKSVNLEVSKEFCETHCGEGKPGCKIEDGITPAEVLKYVEIK